MSFLCSLTLSLSADEDNLLLHCPPKAFLKAPLPTCGIKLHKLSLEVIFRKHFVWQQ